MINSQKNITYQEAISVLMSQGKFYINLGLERCQNVLALLGNPEKRLKWIHVAGTNGKGSVCAMLSAILTQKGLKTGLFTSPHVFEYTERIKINDIEIEKDVFATEIKKVVNVAQENDIHLTEFEILTVAAFDYFAQNDVDIVVLETGLGGRLDATNVSEQNLCSIITSIGFDHTERLGDTVGKIAYEKAGIIKANCPVIVSADNLGFEVIQKVAGEKNSEVLSAKNLGGDCPPCPLKGSYQSENLALVLCAIELLNKKGFLISDKDIEKGLTNVKHPCRFEYLKDENILIDGAHNSEGIRALRESIYSYFPNQKIKFIFGCLRNKNYAEMMKNLFTAKDSIFFYQFDNTNACTYEELSAACDFNSKPFSEFKRDDNSLTVVCGSFYMIKELLTKMGIK